jgi:rhamnosyltransferase
LYHPSQKSFFSKFQVLQRSVDCIVLVDNTESGTDWLGGLCGQYPEMAEHVVFKCFQPLENLGIAAAQNLALDFVFQHFSDQDKVIFFDQDSEIPSHLPASLTQEFERLSFDEPVAAVGPSFMDEQKGFVYPQVNWSASGIFKRFIPDEAQNQQRVCSLISSGMLTSVECLKEVGGYDELLFIDYVDTDWCLKAQSKGYVLYVIPSVVMRHAIGAKSVRVLGRDLSVHSAKRRYYMLRNSFFMLRKPYVGKWLALSFVYRTLVHHLILILMTPDRRKQISALLKGIINGVLNIK